MTAADGLTPEHPQVQQSGDRHEDPYGDPSRQAGLQPVLVPIECVLVEILLIVRAFVEPNDRKG